MEQETYHISSYCQITKGKINWNGQIIHFLDSEDFTAASKSLYKDLELTYPKFFKMDALSKLAFIAAEYTLKGHLDPNHENDVALLFANQSSSLDTDLKFQESIASPENYFPSPAVFVYTLPNICMGEISIRHQLKSENSFFIFDAFNAKFMAQYAQLLLDTGKAQKVLCGWVELLGEEYRGLVYLVEKQGTLTHEKENIQILYDA